jgi:hypothetical protein
MKLPDMNFAELFILYPMKMTFIKFACFSNVHYQTISEFGVIFFVLVKFGVAVIQAMTFR